MSSHSFAITRSTLSTPAAILILLASLAAAAETKRPNVVLILTDNHGAWTLGCYGNRDIRTPHIDRLAREGTLFESCYSSNAVCSPTRATLLTGLIPSQHGVHCYLNAGEPQIGPNAYCTIGEFRTLPKILSSAGYTCGLVGKWHLGDNLHPQENFQYWITMPHGATSTFYDAQVIENGEIRKEPTYLTDLWTQHGLKFIDQNKDKQFFLMLSYNGPYGLGQMLNHPARNRHGSFYADKELPSFPREEIHPWLFNNRNFINNPVSIRRYAAEISAVDDGVGEVMAALARHGLDDNTLVVFTGDQGLAGGHSGFWGMGDHTRPLTAYDWTMHVPLVFRQPGRVAANNRNDMLVSNYDFLPTILDYLDLKSEAPTKPASPGHSYAAALSGPSPKWDDTVFFEFETVRAIRTKDRKYIERFPDGPNELYDLKTDPGERNNLIDDSAHAAEKASLQQRLHAFFDRHADPQYDLTHGGRSKSKLLSARLAK
jgi:arylsulfatase A-like enzyme